jgi:hypothetical protein
MDMIIDVTGLVLTLATLGVCITILVRLENLARRRKYALKRRAVKSEDVEGAAV